VLDWLFGGVALLNVYALALVVLRAPLYGTRVYRPMLLNIGLSIAPVLVLGLVVLVDAVLIAGGAPQGVVVTVAALGFLVWLLLLPNAGYLVTELNYSHRQDGERVPLWYDIVAVLTLAMSGVLNTVVNVFVAQALLAIVLFPDDDEPFRRPASWVAVVVVLALVSVGVYLGRYVRFNSWDLLHPAQFARKLVQHFRARGVVRDALLFVVLHTVFFALMYAIVMGPITTLLVRGA
jgi:uncharacterized membrane protein